MTAHRYPGGIISASAPTVTSNSAVGVWTVEEAVRYKAAGTWPDGAGTDPYFRNTTLLLHGDGTNGAQNNTFLDGSTNNFTITRNGNTTQGSFDPYVGPGCWSNYFNGSTDYLSVSTTASAAFGFGTADFTVEAWVYYTGTNASATKPIIDFRGAVATAPSIFGYTSNQLAFYYNGSVVYQPASLTLTSNAWNHVALVRSSGVTKFYLNGTGASTTYTDTNNYPSAACIIGTDSVAGGTSYWSGYLSNIRVVKGYAVYTSNFTPTTPLVATTQTTLLTCNNSGFIDQSAANFAITRNGSTQVSKFSPFTLYQTVPTSYSGYFNGVSTAYLNLGTAANLNLGTGDFTIEFWYYPVTIPSGNTTILSNGNAAWGASAITIVGGTGTTSSTAMRLGAYDYSTTGSIVFDNAATALNQWTHYAFTRSGNNFALYRNGVSVSTNTWTGSINLNNNNATKIGGGSWDNASVNGSISNLRIVKGQALYTTNFTPSTSPLTTTSQGATAANVSLLTCQSTTFIDNSTNAFTITANGNATPKRANPFTDTVTGPTQYVTTTYGGSAYFDGTGDYLTVPTSAGLNLGASDFTMEGWVYLSATQSSKYLFGVGTVDGTTRSAAVWIGGTQKVEGYFSADGSTWLSYRVGTTTVAANQWAHVAFVRSGTTLYLFLNGALEGTQTGTPTTAASGYPAYIGGQSATYQLNGYLSNIRIVKGTALYTAPFVPPAAPVTAVTNTQLLVNGTNAGIFDNTTVNDLETVGSAQVSTSVVKYGTGSMSFNGTNSYLTARTTPTMAMGTGNFTIEYWINATSFSTTPTIIDFRGSANNLGFSDYITTAGQINIWKNTGSILSATSNLTTGTWYFIAYVRNNGTLTIYINGVASGSVADTTNWVAPSDVMNIASYKAGTGGYFNGYLDDIRVTLGYARYTTNFTPPTGPFPNI